MFSLLHPFHPSGDLAVDFGTAVLRTAHAESARLIRRPSVAGSRPALRDGVVADPLAATALLRDAFQEFGGGRHLRVLACAPSDATERERHLLLAALREAGAETAALIPEPIAALVGDEIDIGEPHMVIDFGEGVVDCAVVMEKKIRAHRAIRGGCGALRNGLIAHLGETAGLRLTPAEAEQLLRHTGLESSAGPALYRLPPVCAELARRYFRDRTNEILHPILRFVETLEPETCAEVISNGIEMTGGGTLIPGLSAYCARETGLPIEPARRPLESVIRGACSILGPTARLGLWNDLQSFWNGR